MIQSFMPKDIESLSKLSSILIIPFISAAVYADFGLWAIDYFDGMESLALSDNAFVSILTNVIAFIISVVFITIIVEFSPTVTHRWNIVTPLIGFSFLTFGVLGIGHVAHGVERYTFNIFWHLGSLVWGLDIFTNKKP